MHAAIGGRCGCKRINRRISIGLGKLMRLVHRRRLVILLLLLIVSVRIGALVGLEWRLSRVIDIRWQIRTRQNSRCSPFNGSAARCTRNRRPSGGYSTGRYRVRFHLL